MVGREPATEVNANQGSFGATEADSEILREKYLIMAAGTEMADM